MMVLSRQKEPDNRQGIVGMAVGMLAVAAIQMVDRT